MVEQGTLNAYVPGSTPGIPTLYFAKALLFTPYLLGSFSIGEAMYEIFSEAFKSLPNLLENKGIWDSLIVNRRKPYTYRVFTQLDNGYRLCLHKFDVCSDHEAFVHPHPWPGAFKILRGAYKMDIGYSQDRESPPSPVLSTIMTAGSYYEITNPLTWHSVIPLQETWTVMVNGEPWPFEYAHKDIRTTKGKDLDKMPQDELEEHLDMFNFLLRYGY